MKFFFRLLLLLLLAALAGVYFFIPSSITVQAHQSMRAPSIRISAFIENQQQWKKWWPVSSTNGPEQQFKFNNNNYSLGRKTENVIEILARIGDSTLSSRMLIAAISTDSTVIDWSVSLNSNHNPVKKFRNYLNSKKINADFQVILNALKAYVEKQENVYGMQIVRERVKDTVLVATRSVFPHYPNTGEVYAMVAKLKSYIESEKASETNFPMLHVVKSDSSSYETMVAIPTNRPLPGKGAIELKRMVPGFILRGEVKGGPYTTIYGLEQLENYRYDNRYVSPAIPFALLVTDRSKEPDTAKWITRLYYPVF